MLYGKTQLTEGERVKGRGEAERLNIESLSNGRSPSKRQKGRNEGGRMFRSKVGQMEL